VDAPFESHAFCIITHIIRNTDQLLKNVYPDLFIKSTDALLTTAISGNLPDIAEIDNKNLNEGWGGTAIGFFYPKGEPICFVATDSRKTSTASPAAPRISVRE
jgi:hypothetical protein